jgi:hypothetical protein
VEATVELDPRKCEHVDPSGQRCNGWRTETGLCAGHRKLGLAANPVGSAQRSSAVRQEKAEARRERLELAAMSTKEAVARAAEELQPLIVDAYRDAITTGEPAAIRRAEAAERLLSRVYGRPTEHMETTPSVVPASVQALRDLSHEQRLELLRGIDAGKALRLVDADDSQSPSS